MLVRSPRQTPRDLVTWDQHERVDAVEAERIDWDAATRPALDAMEAFASAGPCYVGTSWGKDSTVVAHLAVRLIEERSIRLPLVWVRREPIDNPDCVLVRDEFARRFGGTIEIVEILVECERDRTRPECWWTRGIAARTPSSRPKQVGFALAAQRFGDRYISGVRAAESGDRVRRMRRHGPSTHRTCAPIGWWPTQRVFAYLYAHDLPVHPAYAQTGAGLYPRDRIRVGSVGSHHGQGFGRAEWEQRYYPDIAKLNR